MHSIATSLLRRSPPLTVASWGRSLPHEGVSLPGERPHTLHRYFRASHCMTSQRQSLARHYGVQAPGPLILPGLVPPPSTPERFTFVVNLR